MKTIAEATLVGLAAVVILAITAQWIATRIGFPSILLLLVTGFVAGPVTGFLDPDMLLGDLLLPLVSLSVGLILFEGGMNLQRSELRDVGRAVRNLITVGILVTWALGTAGAHLILGLDVGLALLVGAIFIVTGPTVIIPLLRQVRPSGQVSAALKWEGILNDPVGAVVAVLVFEALVTPGPGEATLAVLSGITKAAVYGSVIGVAGGLVMVFLLRRNWVPEFLENPVTLMTVVAAFTLSDVLQPESGLIAATLMGVVMANQKEAVVHHILEFKESLGVLLIGSLFILLAARLEVEAILDAGIPALLFLAFLVLVVRPASVFASTMRTGLNWRERVFLAAMAPRGVVAAAIASVFALRLSEAGVPGAERIVPITFVVIIGTVTLYGLTASPLTRLLNLATPNPQGILVVGAHAWSRRIVKALFAAGHRAILVDANRGNVHAARQEGLLTYRGSILSERVDDDLDLAGIGRYMALTSNDEVNSLGAVHYRDLFGRAAVYQLQPRGEENPRLTTPAQHLRGRVVFAPGATYDTLTERFRQGWDLRIVDITTNRTFASLRERYEGNMVPLFLLGRDGNLSIVTAADPPVARPNDRLLALVAPDVIDDKEVPWEVAPEAVPRR